MMDRRPYDSYRYCQVGNYCVLASYAAALWPWLRATPLSYFEAYCRHFGLPTEVRCAERTYEADFPPRYSMPGSSGYGIIQSLHDGALEPIFQRARAGAAVRLIGNVVAEATALESELQAKDTVLMAFVNKSAWPGLSAGHSITILYDGAFYHVDSNIGAIVLSAPSLSDLGELGHGLLFTGRLPVATAV